MLLGVYEFSRRTASRIAGRSSRWARPIGAGRRALARLDPEGGTPIGQAMITAKRALDATGLSRRHLLVVSDGENTNGFKPGGRRGGDRARPDNERPSIYFVAFDIEARRFNGVRNAGGLVLSAANAHELNDTLDMLLKGKILMRSSQVPNPPPSSKSQGTLGGLCLAGQCIAGTRRRWDGTEGRRRGEQRDEDSVTSRPRWSAVRRTLARTC